MAKNQNTVLDELDAQIDEVSTKISTITLKEEKTDEDNKQLEELKAERKGYLQKRVDVYASRAKEAEYLKAEAERKLAERDREVEELKRAKEASVTPVITTETMEIGGKKFYTDKALETMIKVGQITDAEAYAHQRQRERAEDKQEILESIKGNKSKEDEAKIRQEDTAMVLKEHPEFDKTHPDHDPNNELYKLATELWQEGYFANPRGMSKALERAKRMLGVTKVRPDVTDDLSVHTTRSSASKGNNNKIELSEEEVDTAVQMYTRGDVMNPVTGRPYTRDEAIAKARAGKAALLDRKDKSFKRRYGKE